MLGKAGGGRSRMRMRRVMLSGLGRLLPLGVLEPTTTLALWRQGRWPSLCPFFFGFWVKGGLNAQVEESGVGWPAESQSLTAVDTD